MPEITDSEEKVITDYRNEFAKIVKKGRFDDKIVSLVQSWQGYFLALCVKYNQNPFDAELVGKKWGPRTD